MKLMLLTLLFTFTINVNMASTLTSEDSVPLSSLDYAQVTFVNAVQSRDGSWCFQTQVKHNDSGWEHYANGWQVSDSKKVISKRILAHPHVDEQPFTRSHCGINIEEQERFIKVSAKCNVHGLGGHEITLDMSKYKGENYHIKRIDKK